MGWLFESFYHLFWMGFGIDKRRPSVSQSVSQSAARVGIESLGGIESFYHLNNSVLYFGWGLGSNPNLIGLEPIESKALKAKLCPPLGFESL